MTLAPTWRGLSWGGALGRTVDASDAGGDTSTVGSQGADLVGAVESESAAVHVLGALRLTGTVVVGDDAGEHSAGAASSIEAILTDCWIIEQTS